MKRLIFDLEALITVFTSLITIYIKNSKSHLTSPTNATPSNRAKETDNNKKESPAKIVSKTTQKRNNVSDTHKKKGKPRTKIKARDRTNPTPN